MKVTLNRDAFSAALEPATAVADRKSTMPVLGMVLLDVSGDSLSATATSLDETITSKIDTVGAALPGKLALPAKDLSALVKRLDGEQVTIEATEKQHAIVTSGKSRYRILGLSAGDFPSVPRHDGKFVSVEGPALAAVAAKVMHAISTDPTRHHMNGACIAPDGKRSTVIGLDGHRMTVVRAALPKLSDKPIIVPAKCLRDLAKLAESRETVEIAVEGWKSSGYLFASTSDGTAMHGLAIQLIDAQFPPHEQVIPKDHAAAPTMKREPLLRAIRRLSAMTEKGVTFTLTDDALGMRAEDPDRGDGHEVVAVEGGAEMPTRGFSPKYLVEALSVIDSDDVCLWFDADGLGPLLIKPAGSDEQCEVVMPMRL